MAKLTIDLNDSVDVASGMELLKERAKYLKAHGELFTTPPSTTTSDTANPVDPVNPVDDDDDVLGLGDFLGEEDTGTVDDDDIDLDGILGGDDEDEEPAGPTVDDIKDAVAALGKAKGKETATSLLSKVLTGYKVTKISDIPAENIQKVVDAFRKVAGK